MRMAFHFWTNTKTTMMIESIKEGFSLANRNLQLVPVRIVASIINLSTLFAFVGLPLIASVIYLGLDMAQAQEMMPFLIKNPLDFVTRYLGLVFITGISFIFYLTFSSILIMYAIGGTLGVLKNSALDTQYGFRLTSFFREANKHFMHLLWLLSLLLLLVAAILLVFIISGGIIAAIVQTLTKTNSTLDIFFTSFAMLSILIFGIIFILAGIALSMYSAIILVTEGREVMDTIQMTFDFLKKKPQAILFSIILFIGIVILNIILYGIQISFTKIPLISPLIYIFNFLFHSYISIVLWSCLITYYFKAGNRPFIAALRAREKIT